MKNRDRIKLYQHLLDRLCCGFNMLGDEAKTEIKAFVISKQRQSGLFLDRANNPDAYYSLFGCMLSMAITNKDGLNQLNNYLLSENDMQTSTIDALSLILVKILMEIPVQVSKIKIMKQVFNASKTINLYYRLFIAALILEAKGKINVLIKFFFRLLIRSRGKNENTSCSNLAALIVLKQYVNLKIDKDQEALIMHYYMNGGFKAFRESPRSDMLSTAVSLFALNRISYDFRAIKPDCLAFIEDNYSYGAFHSADGDKTRDLEYTFYGLLALGSLNS